MGASKRIAELVVRDLGRRSKTRMTVMRFGNVLGSAGSVISPSHGPWGSRRNWQPARRSGLDGVRIQSLGRADGKMLYAIQFVGSARPKA